MIAIKKLLDLEKYNKSDKDKVLNPFNSITHKNIFDGGAWEWINSIEMQNYNAKLLKIFGLINLHYHELYWLLKIANF